MAQEGTGEIELVVGHPNVDDRSSAQDCLTRILTLDDSYYNGMDWWNAVEGYMRESDDFTARVETLSRTLEGERPWECAVIEVIVDLLLEKGDMHKVLMDILTEPEAQGLSKYPVEFIVEELLRRGADPNKGTGCSGESILHMAVAEENLEVIQLLLEKGAHVNKEDSYGSTPLSDALYISSYEITHLLIMYGADLPVDQKDKMAYMHLALRNGGEELIILLLKQGLSVDNEDKNGWTLLHYAGYYGCEKSAKVLISKGANINATDAYKQTPLHIAAKLGEENIVRCLLNHHADTGVVDYEGNRPLDLAAEEEFSDTFQIFVEHFSPTKHDKMHRKLVKKLMEAKRVKDEIVAEKLNEMSPFEVINMMKPKSCGGDYNFIKDFVRVKTLKKSTRAVMDHFVLGQRRVNCEIIDADDQGIPPDNGKFNAATPSLLDVIVETGNQELASHPAIRAIVDYKWKKFVRWIFLLSCAMYIVRMLLFTAALFIAARPDLDNPGCYRNGWDTLRIVLEALSLIWFLFKAFFQCFKLWLNRMSYFRDSHNYFQILAILLPFTIIPFRAATTWCASTGVGYCVLPEGNVTDINFNQPCIMASHFQWMFASFAYLANAALIEEYLSLYKPIGVYVRILLKILKTDIVHFTILYIIFLFFFVGGFYFALRTGVTILNNGTLISDVNLFPRETLYPWYVLFTGLRILAESVSVIEGYYATDDTTGVYIGYKWFPIIMYLLFLFTIIVVLLNLLIAQMSDSYSKVQEDVEGTFAMARARIVAHLQKIPFIILKKSYRKKYYQKYIWIDAPKVASEKSKEEEAAAKLCSLSERVDKLTRLTEELAEELLKEKRASYTRRWRRS